MKKYTTGLILCLGAVIAVAPAHATLLGVTQQLNSGGAVASPNGVSDGSGSVTDTTLTNAPRYPGGCSTDPNGNPAMTNLASVMTASNPSGAPETLVADTCLLQSTVFGTSFTAQFREAVFQEASGTLDFYMQITVPSSSPGAITDMFLTGFSGVTMDVGTANNVALLGSPGTGTTDETSVSSGGSPSFSHFCKIGGTDCITWMFSTPVGSGDTSFTAVISTNATAFTEGTNDRIGFDSTAGSIDGMLGFAPEAAVPEPMSIVLLGTALIAAAFFIRRRSAAKPDLAKTDLSVS